MAETKNNEDQSLVDRLVSIPLGLPWLDIVSKALRLGRKAIQGLSDEGVYEVLEYESTLDLEDRGGKRATFSKRERVRYLQDNVIAYQDQAWGDGEILVNYRCTPGTPVDRYRSGHKTYILISRREVKNRGDIDEFSIRWKMREGFPRGTEQWETHVMHRTKRLKVSVIFPKSRPPRRTTLLESNRQRSRRLEKKEQTLLPNGRWLVTWETRKPRLYEIYILQWEW